MNQVCLITTQVVLSPFFFSKRSLSAYTYQPTTEWRWGGNWRLQGLDSWLVCIAYILQSPSIKVLGPEGISSAHKPDMGQVWEAPFEVGCLVNHTPGLMAAGMSEGLALWWWPSGVTSPNCAHCSYLLGPSTLSTMEQCFCVCKVFYNGR